MTTCQSDWDDRDLVRLITVKDYDLAATLTSGQAFQWQEHKGGWEGVIGARWVSLCQVAEGIEARIAEPCKDWRWLEHYLQTQMDLNLVLASFPDDAPMHAAITTCRGLRLLRQDPWECLASFILSSTKQIIQIQQIVTMLKARYGQPARVPDGHPPVFAFPTAPALAGLTEPDLRACKMGFRAKYLLAAAQRVASGQLDLSALGNLLESEAQACLTSLAGVGPKIARCVLLFAYGFPRAFPVDVWVMRGLQELYFPKRKPTRKRIEQFITSHFGPQAGYAQQYLFHYMRMKARKNSFDIHPTIEPR